MRADIDAPLLELGHLALALTDDDLDDRLAQPCSLRVQLRLFLGVGFGGQLLNVGEFRLPQRDDPLSASTRRNAPSRW